MLAREASHSTKSEYENRNGLEIQWLGHATIQMKYHDDIIITDPVFSHRLFHLRRSSPRHCQRIDNDGDRRTILISHLHHDHLDISSLRQMDPEATVIVPSGARRFIFRRIRQDVRELATGESYETRNVRIEGVKAVHGGRRWPGVAADAQGYMIHAGSTVYFAGDTKLFSEMATLGSEFDIDLALLPVWGHSPRLGKNHMNPVQAARALSMIGARFAVPIHWGTYRPVGMNNHHFLHRPPHEFASHAAVLAPQTKIRILRLYERVLLDAVSMAA